MWCRVPRDPSGTRNRSWGPQLSRLLYLKYVPQQLISVRQKQKFKQCSRGQGPMCNKTWLERGKRIVRWNDNSSPAVKGASFAAAVVMEQKQTDGRRRKFLGSGVPRRWSGVQGLSLHGELFKWRARKRERLHLSHILLKPLQQMCLLTTRTS